MAEIVRSATVDNMWQGEYYVTQTNQEWEKVALSNDKDVSYGQNIYATMSGITYSQLCIMFTTPVHIALTEFVELRAISRGGWEEFVTKYTLYNSNHDVVATSETEAQSFEFGENATITIPVEKLKNNATYYLVLEGTKSPTGKGTAIKVFMKSVEIVVGARDDGAVYLDNGSGFDKYIGYIDNGESWDQCIPYIDNGSVWDKCS